MYTLNFSKNEESKKIQYAIRSAEDRSSLTIVMIFISQMTLVFCQKMQWISFFFLCFAKNE